jgi:hypothetical protein
MQIKEYLDFVMMLIPTCVVVGAVVLTDHTSLSRTYAGLRILPGRVRGRMIGCKISGHAELPR